MSRNGGLSQEDLDAINAISKTFATTATLEKSDFIAKKTMSIAADESYGRKHFDGRPSSILAPISRLYHFGANKTYHATNSDKSLNGNLRTSQKCIARVAEIITSALTNEHVESYGSPPSECEDHCYKIHDIVFHPKGCYWSAKVDYSIFRVRKSITNQRIQLEYKGKCNLRVICTSVILNDDDRLEGKPPNESTDIDSAARMYHDFLSSKHYSIDLNLESDESAEVGAKNSYPEELERSSTKEGMQETLERILFDLSKQLYKQTLPEFPQGCKGVPFKKIYQLNAKLKSGSFATVCVGTHRESRKQYAIKCVHRRKLSPQDDVSTFSEVNILASLDHPRICSIIDFFIENECYFIVMPLMQGGDVFDRIGNMKKFDESIARNMVFEMLKAIAYLHENDIAHCDLKPKNLLLRNKDDDSSVMLADFGFARKVFSPNSLTKQCGTPYFVAPEILEKKGYDMKADMWSVGVIIYSILSGGVPFTGKNHRELFKTIIGGKYDFDSDRWDGVSDDAKDLIKNLLITEPNLRFSATDSLNHSWIRADSRMLRRNALVSTSQRMKTFNARLTFKTTILATHAVIKWNKVLSKRGSDIEAEIRSTGSSVKITEDENEEVDSDATDENEEVNYDLKNDHIVDEIKNDKI